MSALGNGSLKQAGGLGAASLHCRVQAPKRARSHCATHNEECVGSPAVDAGYFERVSLKQRGANGRPDLSRRSVNTDAQDVAELAKDASEAASRASQAEGKMGALVSELVAIDNTLADHEKRINEMHFGMSMAVQLPKIPSFLKRLQPQIRKQIHEGEQQACGTGYEILLQGFNWESHQCGWYQTMMEQAAWISQIGFTMVWLPPPTESVSPQGYLPRDLYNLNSHYGSVEELQSCLSMFQNVGMKVVGDVVLNHRCATYQNHEGIWNQFGGRLDWDARAILGNDPNFRGLGNSGKGEMFLAAPNIDHSQEFVRHDLAHWLKWLRSMGFDGWRFDFVRGFEGKYIQEYIEASDPHFAVGEFWDSLNYDGDGSLSFKQDSHRQRICDWINATGGLSTAFDITTKGILHAVFERSEYWRLRDDQGKPPGLMGWWPSRAVTFLENHDTGSTQGHWRFPDHGVEQGYVYILTHPGTPTVFYDHLVLWQHVRDVVMNLIEIRKRIGIHSRSHVKIVEAGTDAYAAEIDGRLLMKIGPGHVHVDSSWELVLSGHNWAVWEKLN
ncbi:hypothetical protein BSKO_04618 [Bryopsis sp. KO-2023]|nr:hypothetical protein BSKO_04618 [Bryopsis sp. KO-2023]